MQDLLSSIKKEDYVSISGKVPRSLKIKMEVILSDSNLNINQYIKHMAETLVSGKNLFEEKESEFEMIISTKNAENKRLAGRVSELESLLRNSNDDARLLKNKLKEVENIEKDFKSKEDALRQAIDNIKSNYERRINRIKDQHFDVVNKLEDQVVIYKDLWKVNEILLDGKDGKEVFSKKELNAFILELNSLIGTTAVLEITKTTFFKSLREKAKKNK